MFCSYEGKKKKEIRLHNNFFFFFPTYDEFFALPFLGAGYRALACFVQPGSFPDPWHCCSIQAEPQKPELARPVVSHHPSPQRPELLGPCPPRLRADLLGDYKTDEVGGGRSDGYGLQGHVHRGEDCMYGCLPTPTAVRQKAPLSESQVSLRLQKLVNPCFPAYASQIFQKERKKSSFPQ